MTFYYNRQLRHERHTECVALKDNAVYLETLLKYYEDEVMGEAYFYGPADHIGGTIEREKLAMLAEVERRYTCTSSRLNYLSPDGGASISRV